MSATLYRSENKDAWNDFVRKARNSTFLFERDFMDYHKDRFKDCSVMFYNHKGKLSGVFPANLNSENRQVCSHGGLTYGGLILGKDTSLQEVRAMLKAAAELFLGMGARSLRYKPLPYIYHQYPSEEDLYWLFRAEAQLIARGVSTTIDLSSRLPFSTLRKRKVKKAVRQNFTIEQDGTDNWKMYWKILTDVLSSQHNTLPVHRLEEILLLAQRFPDAIRLYTVHHGDECLAGCVTFDCGTVVHVQYIASNDIGKEYGALDYLFLQLISNAQKGGKRYFDFGISTEQGGQILNEGLLFQKEGFGGRAICYDSYDISLEKIIHL